MVPGLKNLPAIAGEARDGKQKAAIPNSKNPCMCVCVCVFSHFRLFVTLWTVACQAPLSIGFSRQEYCVGLPYASPKELFQIVNLKINRLYKKKERTSLVAQLVKNPLPMQETPV